MTPVGHPMGSRQPELGDIARADRMSRARTCPAVSSADRAGKVFDLTVS